MRFQVRVLRRARDEVRLLLKYISDRSRSGAVSWAKAFDKALVRLGEKADTFPRAAEDAFVGFEVREILFKTRRGLVYRILFTIRGRDVWILHVRGPGQDWLTADELREPW